MRGTLILPIAACVALQTAPTCAQSTGPHAALPERPSVATHAYTVTPGWMEMEAGFEQAWTSGRLGDETLPLTLKFGLARRLQLTVSSAVTHPADSRTTSVDDGSIGIKWRIAESVPVAGNIAILPSGTVPADSEGLATGSFLFIASRTIGPLSLDLNVGYTRREGDGQSAPKHESLWAAAVGGPLTRRVEWLAELSGSPATSGPRGRAATVNSLVGASAILRESVVVDVAFALPLSGPDSRALLFGVVWNIGAIWNGRSTAP